MIDYVKLVIYGCKYTPNFSTCKAYSCKLNDSGIETYKIDAGYNDLDVRYSPTGVMIIEGSLPYFYQGHNFTYPNKAYIETINILQDLLEVELWDAVVDEFEFGCIFPVEVKPVSYIRNHYANPKAKLTMEERGKDKGACRRWEDTARRLKMYDAGKNIKVKVARGIRQSIEGFNPKSNYLKFELHYKNPPLLLGRGITADDLRNPTFLNTLVTQLKEQYKILIPMGKLMLPSDSILRWELIPLWAYINHRMDEGISERDARMELNAIIDQLPALKKSAKENKKGKIRENCKAFQKAPKSHWDLTEKISAALAAEGIPTQE